MAARDTVDDDRRMSRRARAGDAELAGSRGRRWRDRGAAAHGLASERVSASAEVQ